MNRRFLLLISGLVAVTPAAAQQSAPQCPRDAERVPVEFAGWASQIPLTAETSGEGPTIAVGKAYDLKLKPGPKLRLPAVPGPAKDHIGYGGIANLTIERAGIYRIALGAFPWVDLVRDGKALESVAHGHGPACSGIRKVVDFRLTPGRYLITFDGNETDRLIILVAPVS